MSQHCERSRFQHVYEGLHVYRSYVQPSQFSVCHFFPAMAIHLLWQFKLKLYEGRETQEAYLLDLHPDFCLSISIFIFSFFDTEL